MVRIGIIGIGFMGYTHFTGAGKLRGGKVTAIATRSKKKLAGDWRGSRYLGSPAASHPQLATVPFESTAREWCSPVATMTTRSPPKSGGVACP